MYKRAAKMLTPIITALLLVPAWGCGAVGGGGEQLPSLIPVKGKVTYKGRPVTKGMVRFEPDGYGRPARGELQSDGSFVLTTTKAGDGVVTGPHRVSIAASDKSIANDRAFRKYASPNTSKLTAEVDSEHTEHNFDLQ
jgi:hypothetical protein